MYDLIVLDFLAFPNNRKVIIPGTEYVATEYKNPIHHMIVQLIHSIARKK
jgi:hypothetical protein